MRKTQVALAALALMASTAAMAEGVTAYGNVDLTVVSGYGGTFIGTAGNYQQSRLGFRGVEDLGGGMSADFNLESGIGNTGGIGGGGNTSSFFNRAANVGLSTEAFSLRAGTQLSTFIAAQLTGVTGVGGDAAAVPGLYIVNGGNLSQVGVSGSLLGDSVLGGEIASTSGANGGFFVPNSLSATANIGGLNFAVQGRSIGKNADKFVAASMSGSFSGINFAVAHQNITNFWGATVVDGTVNPATTTAAGVNNKQRNTSIGANTEIGSIRMNALWSNNSTTFTEVGDGLSFDKQTNRGYLIGASMPLAGALSGGITYARNSSSSAYGNVEIANGVLGLLGGGITAPSAMATRMISATLKYDFSKSAFLYGTYTNFNTATGIPDNAGIAGATKDLFSVGMVKSF